LAPDRSPDSLSAAQQSSAKGFQQGWADDSKGIPSQDSTYTNDKESYNALIRLIKDARLEGLIDWNVIHDPARDHLECL
jgi:hypothetical protein